MSNQIDKAEIKRIPNPLEPKRFRYRAWAEAEEFERELLATARTPAERAAVLACTPGFFELRRAYWRSRARRKALQDKGQGQLEGLTQSVLALLARLIQRQNAPGTGSPAPELSPRERHRLFLEEHERAVAEAHAKASGNVSEHQPANAPSVVPDSQIERESEIQ